MKQTILVIFEIRTEYLPGPYGHNILRQRKDEDQIGISQYQQEHLSAKSNIQYLHQIKGLKLHRETQINQEKMRRYKI